MPNNFKFVFDIHLVWYLCEYLDALNNYIYSISSQIIKFGSTEITNRNVHVTCELTKTNYEYDFPKIQESNMLTVYT